ncbi:MAG: hypothetical protein ACRELD_13445, partial [Longimicrobiales bacterium]
MRTLSLLGAVALLPACISTPERLPPDPRFGPEPLEARIWADQTGRISYWTNRAAYVAVFEVWPGRGVGMIHPAWAGQQQQHTSGFRWVNTYNRSFRWAYHLTTQISRIAPQPRYLLVVASDRPLQVEQFVARPYALYSALGMAAFSAYRTFDTMEQLAQLALDPGSEWAVDYYTIWPSSVRDYRDYRIVTCRGSSFFVPLDLYYAIASQCIQSETQVAESQPVARVPADSISVPPRDEPVRVAADPVDVDGVRQAPELESQPRQPRVVGPPRVEPAKADRTEEEEAQARRDFEIIKQRLGKRGVA